MFDFNFFKNAVMLGLGLTMDAFSVSLVAGMNEPNISKGKTTLVAGTFSVFQALMPLIGWFLVTTLLDVFSFLQNFIPYVAFALLLLIGGKMLIEGFKKPSAIEEEKPSGLTFGAIILQGVATSIDALSTGFTITDYNFIMALITAVIIAIITFAFCLGGVLIGKKFGNALSNKASIFGGVILIVIGLEIFIKGVII